MKTKIIFILTVLTFSSGAFASLEGTFCLEGYHYNQRITLDQSKNTYRIQSDLSISNMEGRLEVISSEQLKLTHPPITPRAEAKTHTYSFSISGDVLTLSDDEYLRCN